MIALLSNRCNICQSVWVCTERAKTACIFCGSANVRRRDHDVVVAEEQTAELVEKFAEAA